MKVMLASMVFLWHESCLLFANTILVLSRPFWLPFLIAFVKKLHRPQWATLHTGVVCYIELFFFSMCLISNQLDHHDAAAAYGIVF